MKLCFFGSGVEVAETSLRGVEIESIVEIFRKKFDSLIYGGTSIGIMGEFARSFKKNGGKVECVIPKWISQNYLEIINTDGQIVNCQNLQERKEIMLNASDAIICYPGGIGTLDELFFYLTLISVSEKEDTCSVYLYNHDKFFSPMLLQLETCYEVGYISKRVLQKLEVFDTPGQLKTILFS